MCGGKQPQRSIIPAVQFHLFSAMGMCGIAILLIHCPPRDYPTVPTTFSSQDLPEQLVIVKFTEAVRGIGGMLESLAQ